jgi:hypothetical protein
MGELDKARNISEFEQSNLWVIYGKSTSGKTTVAGSFPKPILYLKIGDDGSNSIADVEGVDVIEVSGIEHLKRLFIEAQKDKQYKTILADTFSMLVQEWTDENAIQKKKRMTQQLWGDLAVDTNELVKLAKMLAKKKIVVLTLHEIGDSFEGMEDEIAPDIRPNLSKASRTYIEGMANYGIHTTVLLKDMEDSDGTIKQKAVYACHLGPNPYYWVKTQKPKGIKLPELVINPTYNKIMKLLKGERMKKNNG